MGSSPKPAKQEVIDPEYALSAEARYNRIGQSGPGGTARYVQGPGGNTEIQTRLSPELQELMGRRYGLAMTDSAEQKMPPQMLALAQALAGKVGGRLGVDMSGMAPMQLGTSPVRQQRQWTNPAELPADQVSLPPQMNYRGG
jgi:hypothetical protein